MQYLEIEGGRELHGEITVQGSKNAALPILAASLLGEGPCVIDNCPRIQDVEDTLTILGMLGCDTRREELTVSVDASGVKTFSILGEEAERIRSSILFLGALLGRMGKVQIPYPGGCSIGRRPIDLHIEALEILGAHFSEKTGSDRKKKSILAETPLLRGSRIHLTYPSVGATENIILASVLAEGETLIEGAAREPEIDELCHFLNLRGADISHLSSDRIHIRGQKTLAPVRYRLHADRIVAGSYLLASVACGGCVRIRNLPFQELEALRLVLAQMGVSILEDGTVKSSGKCYSVPYVETAPYPGFPTDLQSPLAAALCTAHGRSTVCETVFEDRFRIVGELQKMGADIEVGKECVRIDGVAQLHGAKLRAYDLRGGAALAGAALAASGFSQIDGYAYVARGYEDISRDFRSLGADICLKNE